MENIYVCISKRNLRDLFIIRVAAVVVRVVADDQHFGGSETESGISVFRQRTVEIFNVRHNDEVRMVYFVKAPFFFI